MLVQCLLFPGKHRLIKEIGAVDRVLLLKFHNFGLKFTLFQGALFGRPQALLKKCCAVSQRTVFVNARENRQDQASEPALEAKLLYLLGIRQVVKLDCVELNQKIVGKKKRYPHTHHSFSKIKVTYKNNGFRAIVKEHGGLFAGTRKTQKLILNR